MRKFIKTLIIFFYFFLALFIQPNSVLACENIIQNTQNQYIISSSKKETELINNRKEEYFILFNSRNKSEITNSVNKNSKFGFGSFDSLRVDYDISDDFTVNNTAYPVFISQNISYSLKNTIYTRAP